MAEFFDQLLPATFDDVHFPVVRMRVSFAHDLVEHKYWGVDGARVEQTGLAPTRFTFTVPWINGIVPGKQERWKAGDLYPNQMRKLVKAFQKKKTGFLQHPEFGTVNVKAERFDLDWAAERRGGAEAELSFVETALDDEASFLDSPSPVQQLQVEADSLDAKMTDLKDLVPELPEYEEDFADAARKIQAIADRVKLLSMKTAGAIDAIVYRVNNIQFAIEGARDATTWPATQNVERLKSAAHDLRQELLRLNRDVVIYTVPGDTTVAGLLQSLPDTTLDDLIKLNPQLMTSPAVSAGTVVRRYRSKLGI